MKHYILIIILFLACNIYSQEVIDKIAAVVDNEIIMESELDYQIQLVAAQRKINPDDPELKKQVLNSMIEEKLVYAQANLDSITVTDDELNQRVEYQLNYLYQQYGSKAKVEQLYGMSSEKIKRVLRENVKKQAMIQKLQAKKFGSVESSRREVEEFFNTYKDSIGVIPEKVTISHILRYPIASETTIEKYKKFAESILDSIKAGADFSEMAKKYSEDPGSAKEGGDLGWVKKGVFYPEFEAAAFALQPGELSDVIESPVGFHIIQLLDKRGESIHTRHILIKIKKGEDADLKAIEFLSELRDSVINDKGDFSQYAKKYSEDKETAPFGGELGTFYLNQLDKSILELVSKMKEGEISFPKRIDLGNGTYGYHIVYLEKRILQHQPSLKTDYNELQDLANNFKKQQKYEEWIKELKSKIYWKVNI
ncbi:MAG TPA: peptidylprolyl isomerase [Ignavibacteriaceae bacterium]|nr:peptidylprolyl isomerase [Ignavibacteriaceae bacterium]